MKIVTRITALIAAIIIGFMAYDVWGDIIHRPSYMSDSRYITGILLAIMLSAAFICLMFAALFATFETDSTDIRQFHDMD